MSDLALLLWPKWRSMVNGSGKKGENAKTFTLVLLAGTACLVIFMASHYILSYIRDLYIGPGLELADLRFAINKSLLGMAVMTFMAVLIFSNIITALSTFFLSDDLQLVGSLPVSHDSVFLARFIEQVVDSSWMVVIFGSPVFVAFGVVYGAGLVYYASIPAVIVPFILIPAGLGVVVTMALVSAFPARNIRDVIFLLIIIGAAIIFTLFRIMRPERVFNPDERLEVVDFLQTIQMPATLPSQWVTEVMSSLANGGMNGDGWMFLALLWTTGLGFVALSLVFSRYLYSDSFSKSQEATRTFISRTSVLNFMVRTISYPFSPATRQMVMKDVRFFMRDTTQWSQLFLLAGLVVIYIFNFKIVDARLHDIKFNAQNAISFLNIGLAGFVLTALSARFVFPMVSLEGRAFWIVKTSPLSLRGFLWSKFLISLLPLAMVGEGLVIITNYILEVETIVWYISLITILGVALAITGLGVGLGARYPKFNVENPSKVATSFGGVIYMVVTTSTIGLMVFLEAQAAAYYAMAKYHMFGIVMTDWGWVRIVASFALAALIVPVAVFVPMKIGRKWIEDLEIS